MRLILLPLCFVSFFTTVACGPSGPGGFLDQVFLAKACPTQAAEQSTVTAASATNASVASTQPRGNQDCIPRGQLCGTFGGLLGECCPGSTCQWEKHQTDTAYCR